MNKARNHNQYLKTCALLGGVLILGATAFNLLVDPFGIYPDTGLDALSEFRRGSRARIAKGEQLNRGKFDLVLLGSSRTLAGVDATDRAFAGKRTFNGGLAGASMEELSCVCDKALMSPSVKEIILFADFFTFNGGRKLSPDFLASRFSPSFGVCEYHLDKIFGQGAMRRSWKVLERWRADDKFRPVFQERSPTAKTLNYYRYRPNMYGKFVDMTDGVGALEHLIRRCEAQQVSVSLVILPVHAQLLETLRHAGLWHMWERWKRALVTLGAAKGQVWDFQNYHSFATRPLPDDYHDKQAASWFFDPSHPTTELCAKVLSRVFLHVPDETRAQNFGRKLTSQNVDDWLAAVRQQRKDYARTFPMEVESVIKMLSKGKKSAKNH